MGVTQSPVNSTKTDGININKLTNKSLTSFVVGPEMNYTFSNKFQLNNVLNLAFHENKFNYEFINNTNTTYYLRNVSVELSPQLKFNPLSTKLKNSSYIVFGPNYRVFLAEQNSTGIKQQNFAFNFGIGLDRRTEFFIFAPEIKYTLGLMESVFSPEPSINTTFKLHTISLLFNFRG